MPPRQARSFAAPLVAGILTLIGPAADAAPTTYIALGDSVAYGETTFPNVPMDPANLGYVGKFAASSAFGAPAPTVFNLAVVGESTATFFAGGVDTSAGITTPAVPVVPGEPAYHLNTHYPVPSIPPGDPGVTPTTQNGLLVSTLIQAGRSVGTITVQLGANDLYQTAFAPGFLGLPPAQQQAQLIQTYQTIGSNVGALLGELSVLAPQAHVYVMGYFNPYPASYATDPSNPYFPVAGLAGSLISQLNATLDQVVGHFDPHNVTFVDPSAAFVGHEEAYTHIGDFLQPNSNPLTFNNFHPNDAGYAAIAASLEAAAVPEPSAMLSLTIGLAGLVGAGRRRSRRRA